MAKRKKKPISQTEKSRRFLQAAREAGVDERAAKDLRGLPAKDEIIGVPKLWM